MKILSLLLLLTVSFQSAVAQNEITGKWLTAGGDAHIIIAPASGGKFSGRIVWLREPREANGKLKTDSENPNASLRHRAILGLEILKDFRPNGKNTWEGGTIYDPKTGRTYSSNITLQGSKLHVRGFVGISMLGRTEIWSRLSPD